MDDYLKEIAEMDREIDSNMETDMGDDMDASLFDDDGMDAEDLDDEFGPLEL